MKIKETLQELLTMPLDAEVWCQTGDFGPCVSYDPADYVGEDEDGWEKGNVFIQSSIEDKRTLTVSEVIDKLLSFDPQFGVMVSDGFEAKPYLIKSCREFANQEQKHAGYTITDKQAKEEYGNLKYPLIVFDI